MGWTQTELRDFSLTRALAACTDGGLRPGLEREVLMEATEKAGRPFTDSRFVIPFAFMARAMSAAGDGGSNYTIGTDTRAVEDVLREASLTARVGATVLPGLKGNVTIPAMTAGVTGQWLTSEFDPINEATPTVGQITMNPKTAATIVRFSGQLRHQTTGLDRVLARHLSRAIGAMLDRAALQGSGTNGEPMGVAATPGIQSFTGAALTHAECLSAVADLEDAEAEPSAWIGPPSVHELLAARERAAGSGFIWERGEIAGVPARATVAAPSAGLFLGDWRHLLIGIWSSGIELAVDPFSSFEKGVVQMRAMLACDVAVRHRQAFAYSGEVS